MSRPRFRDWLSGLLEGLAGREVDPKLLDRVIVRAQEEFGHGQAIAQEADENEDQDDAPPTPQPKSLSEALEKMKKMPGRKKAAAAPSLPLENSTPVADKPPYNPDDPKVVRLG